MTREEREEMAGPKPPEQTGYELYVRLNHNRFGDAYVWLYRRKVKHRRRRLGDG